MHRRRQRTSRGLAAENRLAAGRADCAVRSEGRGLRRLHVRGQQQTRTLGQEDHHRRRDR